MQVILEESEYKQFLEYKEQLENILKEPQSLKEKAEKEVKQFISEYKRRLTGCFLKILAQPDTDKQAEAYEELERLIDSEINVNNFIYK